MPVHTVVESQAEADPTDKMASKGKTPSPASNIGEKYAKIRIFAFEGTAA